MRRRVRIAVSVFLGVVAVALCVSWVQSYWWDDSLTVKIGDRTIWVESLDGIIFMAVDPHWYPYNRWFINEASESRPNGLPRMMGFGLGEDFTRGYFVAIPHWFAILVTMALAASNNRSIRFQFSVRSILVAMTLVAVILGLAVWLAS